MVISAATKNPSQRGFWLSYGLHCLAAPPPNLTQKARREREIRGKAAADPAIALGIARAIIATSQRAIASVIAATKIAGAVDAGENLRTVNLQLANSLGAGSNPAWSRARTLSTPSVLAAGEAGAADSGTVMERQIRRARPPRRMNQTMPL